MYNMALGALPTHLNRMTIHVIEVASRVYIAIANSVECAQLC